jgi:hypothetical protein
MKWMRTVVGVRSHKPHTYTDLSHYGRLLTLSHIASEFGQPAS